jgi:phosphopantetheinyl transferase (holo-ACP synthase)
LSDQDAKNPDRLQKILTDNGKEFTDRLFASRERQASGNN